MSYAYAVAPPLSLALSNTPRVVLNSSTDLAELFARVARQDRAAFSELYDQLSPLVYGLALRTTKAPALAEEVTQEVFLQVWRQADRFDPSRGSAKSWVATLAHRRAVDTVRRSQAAIDREDALPKDPSPPDVSEEIIELDERARVREAVGRLTELQRQVIEMAYFGGLTYREVAEKLDAPLGTVKTRMRDGLMRMRSIMEAGDDRYA